MLYLLLGLYLLFIPLRYIFKNIGQPFKLIRDITRQVKLGDIPNVALNTSRHDWLQVTNEDH